MTETTTDRAKLLELTVVGDGDSGDSPGGRGITQRGEGDEAKREFTMSDPPKLGVSRSELTSHPSLKLGRTP